jgi:hypothetical protein
MRRRAFISLLVGGAAAWPLAARAQQAGKVPIIGFLGTDASSWSPYTAAFSQRLRELGWIDDRTIAIEYRWAEGRSERYAEIAAEFVRLKRPGRRRPGRKSGAAWRQRHWPVGPVDRSYREATRTLARDCPPRPPVSTHRECRLSPGRCGDG